ncbi:MAG: hypothetical protein IT462_04900 [Planctomycetes bacterium]|nr:hypothetical protein [Planctomycetota bacterium]
MRFKSIIGAGIFALAACITACTTTPQPTVENTPAPKGPDLTGLPADCKLTKSVAVDGAVIYAVASTTAANTTDYLTLDEAMTLKVATVKEVGADDVVNDDRANNAQREISGSVNTLLVCNDSDKPLFLMAGDLVLGGKQDRILAESVVVAPRTRNQEIPVFCVEHGRWTVQAKDAEKVEAGVFFNTASTGQCDLAVKKAALETRQQGEVWRKVADNNRALNVEGEAASGTFRSTFENKATQEKIEANYLKAKKLATKGVIGFAVFVEDKMVAMDVFDSSKLANKLSEKLLRSYIVTGLSGGYTEKAVMDERAAMGRAANDNMIPVQTATAEANDPTDVEPQSETVRGVYAVERLNDSGDTERNGLPRRQTLRNTPAPAVEDKDRVETTVVNDRTENSRDYKKDSLGYTCNDKTTGKPVQRSFMRR